MSATPGETAAVEFDAEIAFYQDVLRTLDAARVPALVGGAYAFAAYTGIARNTKDLDLFLRPVDYERAAAVLGDAGYDVQLAFPHWLGKVHSDPWFVDLIFDSGNGATPVDDGWFEHALPADVLGAHAKIVPVEEMIWSKAFIMERERYDGADVAHMLHACSATLDWARLLDRFGRHWRVLMSHLVLFGFIYPGERDKVPRWLMDALLARLRDDMEAPSAPTAVCQGTLLSREQYLHDLREHGYTDGRLVPFGSMAPDAIAIWTQAIGESKKGMNA